MAHELAHVRHRDTLIMTVAATLSGAIGMLASFGGLMGGGRDSEGRPLVNPIVAIAAMILAPMAAMLVQMAISRGREYEADRMGAEICGQPHWLASALAKLHAGTQQIHNEAARAAIPRPPTCTLPTRSPWPAACRACSRPIRRWRSASRACRRWAAKPTPRRARRPRRRPAAARGAVLRPRLRAAVRGADRQRS